jgi:hypothetical protein
MPRPGDAAGEILRLADAWREAALTLTAAGGTSDAEARAPARFCALHAIELYLDAFLRHLGESPGRLRAHGHDLRLRAALAIAAGLNLRRKTALHLAQLTMEREYLALRYGPKRAPAACELNRLTASLDEIGREVRAACRDAGGGDGG